MYILGACGVVVAPYEAAFSWGLVCELHWLVPHVGGVPLSPFSIFPQGLQWSGSFG